MSNRRDYSTFDMPDERPMSDAKAALLVALFTGAGYALVTMAFYVGMFVKFMM